MAINLISLSEARVEASFSVLITQPYKDREINHRALNWILRALTDDLYLSGEKQSKIYKTNSIVEEPKNEKRVPKENEKRFRSKSDRAQHFVQKGKKNLTTTTVKCKIPKILGISWLFDPLISNLPLEIVRILSKQKMSTFIQRRQRHRNSFRIYLFFTC